jgi:hypothetical protein
MRRAIGFVCYLLGGASVVLAFQLLIGCELLSAFSKVENQRYDFWDFIFVANGHHRAYPNGFLVHLARDIFVALWAAVIIRLGRQQFVYRKKTRAADKIALVTCPGCEKKTYADAYCRFCGFNLITHKPSSDAPGTLPLWKVSVLAYSGVSVLLLIINLLLRN